jgi:hypothetical protein
MACNGEKTLSNSDRDERLMAADGIMGPEKHERSSETGNRSGPCPIFVLKPQESFMTTRTAAVALLLTMSIASAPAAVRIFDDRGGRIGDYLVKYHALRLSGQQVEIDGLCASACTLILGAIPRNRICVTPKAVLEFHTAWDPGPSGNHVINSAGNRLLWSSYPNAVRRWISEHGGLGHQIIDLSGAELAAIYPPCR